MDFYLYYTKEQLKEKTNDFLLYLLKKINRYKDRTLSEKLKDLVTRYSPE